MSPREGFERPRMRLRLPRLVTVVSFVVIQAAVLVAMFVLFRNYFAYYYVVCIALTVLVALHLLYSGYNPAYKIAWLVPIMLFPIFGGLFYLVYAKRKPLKKERALLNQTEERFAAAIAARPDASEALALEADHCAARQSDYIRSYAGTPPYRGTRTRYFPSGEAMFADLLRELEKAERFIFMEFFIIDEGEMWDSVLEILTRKAAEGVDVRLLYDDVGCIFNLPEGYAAKIESLGIRCAVFNRLTNIFSSRFNNRDHRKICVIDGAVAYTGGVNLADEYINAIERFGHWKDSAIAVEGEAAWSLCCMFLSMWEYVRGVTDEDYLHFAPPETGENFAPDGGYVQPYCDTPLDEEAVGENVYMNMIGRAQDYVYITTPYLILDSELQTVLTTCAKSGVDVRILTPAVPDKKLVFSVTRSNYGPLLDAGVRIFEYTPGFLHAKTFVCDDRYAVVGSVNLDFRSLFLHYECGVWLCEDPAVADVREDFLQTQAQCREIRPGDLKSRRLLGRLALIILRMFSPLM